MILNPPKTFSFWHWIVKDEVETIPSPAPGLAFAIVRLRTTPTQRKTDPALDSWELIGHAPLAARGTALAIYNNIIYMSGGFTGGALNNFYRIL